ncbi:MAG: dihydrofolate reductase [Fibrobacteria bacterium]|nr:dihydrofolate reductase [Fibrobacteria bacterium]
MTPLFSIVVATDLNLGIGKDGGLPWRLKNDIRFFKDLTLSNNPIDVLNHYSISDIQTLSIQQKQIPENTENTVIMGRKTWESIPDKFRPLPGRRNIILSRHPHQSLSSNIIFCSTFNEAIETAPTDASPYLYIIGGEAIYHMAMQHPSCAYIFQTVINTKADCDAFFPAIPEWFKEVGCSPVLTENQFDFRFKVLANQGI